MRVERAAIGSKSQWVFNPSVVRDWLKDGGKLTIDAWVQHKRGQGVLKLVSSGT